MVAAVASAGLYTGSVLSERITVASGNVTCCLLASAKGLGAGLGVAWGLLGLSTAAESKVRA